MTFDSARPRYTLPFAGAEYDLLGTMGLIEAVEFTLKRGIVKIAVDVVNDMQTNDLARLLAAILTTCGHKTTLGDVLDRLWSIVGVSGDANLLLRGHLYWFLTICMAPPEKREAKVKDAGEWIGKLPKASPGASTSPSASAP